MNGQFNIWNKWDPLKTVMLGDCYAPEFFRDIKSPKIRSALDRIATETKEDLEYYEKVLKDFGCEVLRPEIDKSISIMDFIDHDGKITNYTQGVPRAPLQPRDAQLVLGNLIYFTGRKDHKAIIDSLLRYTNDLSMIKILQMPTGCKKDDIEAPSFTLIGKDLYIDLSETNNVKDKHIDGILKNIPNLRINTLNIGGHSDGCFHTLKPGAILSLDNIQKYSETFPDWEVCFVNSQTWSKLHDFLRMKDIVNGKWWVPGEEDNDEFTNFVETWLQDWVGYCEESVFDVNVLMLDDRHVCVNNYNETAFAFFKKHKIEPIIVPWRHRFFWDGGLHCITLDLYREGEMQDYFPTRSGPIVDLGFD